MPAVDTGVEGLGDSGSPGTSKLPPLINRHHYDPMATDPMVRRRRNEVGESFDRISLSKHLDQSRTDRIDSQMSHFTTIMREAKNSDEH